MRLILVAIVLFCSISVILGRVNIRRDEKGVRSTKCEEGETLMCLWIYRVCEDGTMDCNCFCASEITRGPEKIRTLRRTCENGQPPACARCPDGGNSCGPVCHCEEDVG